MRGTLLVCKTACTTRACASVQRDGRPLKGILECAALVLALSTFHDLVQGGRSENVHRQSRGSRCCCRGGTRCLERNNMTAHMWLLMAESALQVGLIEPNLAQTQADQSVNSERFAAVQTHLVVSGGTVACT